LLVAKVENAPPATCLMPTRSTPCSARSNGVEQIEYERRTSGSVPFAARRTVRCWPARNANVSRSSAGTANSTATASSVSRSTSSTRSAWNVGRRRCGVVSVMVNATRLHLPRSARALARPALLEHGE
jgi:hypothetical protein